MNDIHLASLYVMCGVSGYLALRNTIIVLRRRANVSRLLFALLSFAATAILVTKAVALQEVSEQVQVLLQHLEILALCIFFALFPWFVFSYADIRQRKVLTAITGFWFILFAVNLVLLQGISHDILPAVSQSSDEILEKLSVPWSAVAHHLIWIGMFMVFAYSINICVSLYRNQQRARASRLVWGVAIFLGLILCSLAVSETLTGYYFIREVSYIVLLVVMDLAMMLDARDHRRRMLSVLDNLPVAIALKDLKGNYQLINRKFATLFHVNSEDIVGKTDIDIFNRDQAEDLRTRECQALEKREEVVSEDVLILSNKQLHCKTQIVPLTRLDGSPYGVCSVRTDITASWQRDEALRKIRQYVWHVDRVASTGVITGSIAHELCQPLAAILSNA